MEHHEDEDTVCRGHLTSAVGLAAQPVAAEDLTLEFVVWNYSLETIQDNVKKFEEANPGVKVKVTDYTWPDYQDSIVLRFRGGTTTDVIYGGQDWLPAWGAAGFIAPLDSVAPAGAVDELRNDIAGFALTDVTYKDKVYGLPYYGCPPRSSSSNISAVPACSMCRPTASTILLAWSRAVRQVPPRTIS
jgi:ABC-type glycerol-3-phosphate transport system substrate-binding protein